LKKISLLIPNIQSLFEFLLRKLDLSNPHNQEIYDKSRKLFGFLQTVNSELDSMKDNAALLNQKNREKVVYLKDLFNDFFNQISLPPTASSSRYPTRLAKLTQIIGDDSISFRTILNSLIEMLNYTITIYSEQAPPIQAIEVGSGEMTQKLYDKNPYPPNYPVFFKIPEINQKDLEEAKLPYRISRDIIAPLGIATWQVEFPFGSGIKPIYS
jgi:hypothetical protein